MIHEHSLEKNNIHFERYMAMRNKCVVQSLLGKFSSCSFATTKTLANIYGISYTSVKQKLFNFKKKIGLDSGQQSVRQFIEQF